MNTFRFALALSLSTAFIGTSIARADGAKRATEPKVKSSACCDACGPKSSSKSKAAITGSLIPDRPGSARDNTTRASGPVVILTAADLQRIGARDLTDALRRGIGTGH